MTGMDTEVLLMLLASAGAAVLAAPPLVPVDVLFLLTVGLFFIGRDVIPANVAHHLHRPADPRHAAAAPHLRPSLAAVLSILVTALTVVLLRGIQQAPLSAVRGVGVLGTNSVGLVSGILVLLALVLRDELSFRPMVAVVGLLGLALTKSVAAALATLTVGACTRYPDDGVRPPSLP